jgi:hypothetical protein
MSIIANDINQIRNYSLISDASENKTVFLLGVLDVQTRAFLDDTYSIFDSEKNLNDINLHRKYLEFVRLGLKGWENLCDINLKPIEFKTEEKIYPGLGKRIVVSEDSLNKLRLIHIIEIGIQIVRDNTINSEDKKK